MTSFLTQILGSGTGKYFADASGAPFMVKGDTVWGLLTNAGITSGTTYQQDITNYFATRQSQGFNAVLVAAPISNAGGNPGFTLNGNTHDGVAPFTSPGVLNNTYWTRVDYLLSTAASYGFTVILDVFFAQAEEGAGAPLNGWTDAQYQAYGTAAGTRYASTPNLVWFVGNDWDQSNTSFFSEFMASVRAAGASQFASCENQLESTSRHYAFDGSSDAWGTTYASFNWCYSYNADYVVVEFAYQESSPLCVLRGDGFYEGNDYGQGIDTSLSPPYDARFMRNLLWWALSSGSRGYVAGDNNVWNWQPYSYQALTNLSVNLASSGPAGINGATAGAGSDAFTSVTFPAALAAFGALPGWHQLVPDTGSALVTAGRGTHLAELSSGNTYQDNNSYVSASKTPNGSLAVIYMPNHGTTSTITVNGSLMQAGYKAYWIDPFNGTKTTATIGSTYTNGTTNSAGDPDWVLALQGPVAAAAVFAWTGPVQAAVATLPPRGRVSSGRGAPVRNPVLPQARTYFMASM